MHAAARAGDDRCRLVERNAAVRGRGDLDRLGQTRSGGRIPRRIEIEEREVESGKAKERIGVRITDFDGQLNGGTDRHADRAKLPVAAVAARIEGGVRRTSGHTDDDVIWAARVLATATVPHLLTAI